MNRLVLLVAAAAIALIVPGVAQADSPHVQTTVNAAVANGVATYTSGAGTVDNVTVMQSFGGVTISEPTSPEAAPVGAGCSVLSATSAYCFATSVSIQTLDLDDTIANGSWLRATLDAGAGADTVTGGVAAETIRAGDGNDTITAGKGADVVDAGPGDDKVDVQDGVVDTVDCGAGSDTIVADADDVLVNCDIAAAAGTVITGTPQGAGEDPSPGPNADRPLTAPKLLAAATLAGPVIAAVTQGSEIPVSKKGAAPFVLACAAEEAKACSGVIFIDPVTKKAKGKKSKRARQSVSAFMARRGRYGSSPFKVKPGSEDKVDVKLSGIALKALGKKSRRRKARAARRGRSVRAVVTIAPKRAHAKRVTIVLKG